MIIYILKIYFYDRKESKVEKGKRLFRSSVRGFNKSDVNTYIVSANQDFSAREAALNAEIASLKKKLSVSAQRLNEAVMSSQRVPELEEQLSSAVRELESSSAKLKSADTRVGQLETELTASNDECTALRARIRELEDSARDAESKKVESFYAPDADSCEKLKRYDELSRSIGEIMLNARCNAERIVKDAELRAGALASGDLENTESTKKQLALVTGRAAAAMKKSAIRSADSYIREFRQYTDSISKSSRSLSAELERKYAELATRADSLARELEETLKSVIRDYDRKCNAIKGSGSFGER